MATGFIFENDVRHRPALAPTLSTLLMALAILTARSWTRSTASDAAANFFGLLSCLAVFSAGLLYSGLHWKYVQRRRPSLVRCLHPIRKRPKGRLSSLSSLPSVSLQASIWFAFAVPPRVLARVPPPTLHHGFFFISHVNESADKKSVTLLSNREDFRGTTGIVELLNPFTSTRTVLIYSVFYTKDLMLCPQVDGTLPNLAVKVLSLPLMFHAVAVLLGAPFFE